MKSIFAITALALLTAIGLAQDGVIVTTLYSEDVQRRPRETQADTTRTDSNATSKRFV